MNFFSPDVAATIDNPDLLAYCEAYDTLYSLLLDISPNALALSVADTAAIDSAIASYNATIPAFTALTADPAIASMYPTVFQAISGIDLEFQDKYNRYKAMTVNADPTYDSGSQGAYMRTEAYVTAHPEAIAAYQASIPQASSTVDTIKKVLPFALGAVALYFAFKG
jgi:hypothetical protein